MTKSAKVTMNGDEYTIHPFNMREMREVATLFNEKAPDMSIRIIEIALRRAEPKIEDIETFEPGCDLNEIAKTVLELSGFNATPPGAVPPTAAQ